MSKAYDRLRTDHRTQVGAASLVLCTFTPSRPTRPPPLHRPFPQTPPETSGRKGTTLEEDQSELELAAEIWCRLGKERLKRGAKRAAEECCGYVTELLPQSSAARRRVHPRLWRWLAVAEGLWGQSVASMVAAESQEKPLQDELRWVLPRGAALVPPPTHFGVKPLCSWRCFDRGPSVDKCGHLVQSPV